MSFYINDVALKTLFFNGSEVNSLYFNGTQVWEKSDWPGWANATWEDVYNLCKHKQSGKVAEWPEDVVLGVTKTTTLSTAVLGTTTFTMTLIGMDIDGAGVLTFAGSKATNSFKASSVTWSSNNVYSYCQNVYDYCDVKPYIKVLDKATYNQTTTNGGSAYITSSGVWALSCNEVGLSSPTGIGEEYTSGVTTAYPYFASNTERKNLLAESYLRTRASDNTIIYYVYSNGASISANRNYTNVYLAPCFAIG